MPNLRRLAEGGIYTKRLRTVFPSVTWNIHTSVITGKGPDEHGIWGNAAYSRSLGTQFSYFEGSIADAGRIRQPVIFDLAAAKGKVSAAICWPLTQGMSGIQYNIPECYAQNDFRRFSSPALVDELLTQGIAFHRYADWSRVHQLAVLQDDLTCRIVTYLIANKQIDVLYAHFLIHDSFQHDFGIRTPESAWALGYLDSLVGRIAASLRSAGLAEKTHFIVFSDHGHEDVYKYFSL